MPARRSSRPSFRRPAVAALIAPVALLAATTGAQAAPAPVASSSANAVTVTVLGTPIGSGVYRTSNDGATASSTGSSAPSASVLHGQSLVTGGTLGQAGTSTTRTSNGRADGSAWSCAGIAGGTATRATSGPDCFTPADAVDVRLGSVDLSGLSIVSSTVMSGLGTADADAVRPMLGDVTTALRAGLADGLDAYGTPRIVLRMDAAQSSCTSDATSASGSTSFDDASLRVVTAGDPDGFALATLPSSPSAGETLGSDVSALKGEVEDAVEGELRDAFVDAMAGQPVDVDAVIANLLSNLGTQLDAFDDDLVTATMNRQTSSNARSVNVTALDLRVSDALVGFGVTDSRVQVGQVSCASALRRAAVSAPAAGGTTAAGTGAAATGGTPAAASDGLPKKVDAGLAGGPAHPGVVLALGMLVLGLGAGAVGSHLVSRRRS